MQISVFCNDSCYAFNGYFGIKEIGGFSIFINELHKISPDYMRWFPSTNFSEFFLAPYMFITGWFFQV